MRLMHIMGLCIIFLAVTVLADVTITNPPNDQVYTVAEDTLFNLTVTAHDTENDSISFKDTSDDENVSFGCFKKYPINATATYINFTPTNEYVGFYSFEISARDSENEVDALAISFNVTNTNDPPVIIDTSNNTVLDENDILTLYVSVQDDDLLHGTESLNISWTLDQHESAKLQPVFANETYEEISFTPSMTDAGNHTITVKVEDLAGKSSNFTWNITVINVNRPPILNQTIPNVSWEEDTNLTDYFDLHDYFYDPDLNASNCDPNTGECISFEWQVVNGSGITIKMNGSNVSFYPDRDFVGNMTVIFMANDSMTTNISNHVLLEVTNINDPPIITPVPDQTNYTYVDFEYQVEATDPEGQFLSYAVSSTLTNISISPSGLLSILPVLGEQGNHTVHINVSDGINATSLNFTLQVLPNNRPLITNLRNYSVKQHHNLSVMLQGDDADGDQLTFTSNLSYLNPGSRINMTAWNFTWLPQSQSLVRNHSVRFTVADEKGAQNAYTAIIQVNDTPVAPILYPVSVPNDQIRTGKLFEHEVLAFDEDGDFTVFSDNTSLFNITTTGTGSIVSNATGLISFTPNSTGYHSIEIAGNDSGDRTDSTILLLNITANRLPYFSSLSDIIAQESVPYSQQVSASDPDWQDHDLVFGDNTSLFNITDGLINFTPADKGNHSVQIWVFDGVDNVSQVIDVNISERDDPPFFDPAIHSLPVWASFMEGNQTAFNITAIDEEGDNVTLNVTFINFTNWAGTSNHALFSFQNITSLKNVTTGYVNVTPGPLDVGTYWINISASDGNTVNSKVFSFDVANINNRPRINWSVRYNGSLIESNATSATLHVREAEPINFSSVVFDPDYDPVTYNWTAYYPNGSVYKVSNTTDFSFMIPYYAAPSFTVVYQVSDNQSSSQVTFSMDTINVNRNVTFGTYKYTFGTRGSFYNTEVDDGLVVSGNGTYATNASFVSEKIDLNTYNANTPRVDHQSLTFEYNKSPAYSLNISFGSVQVADGIVEYSPVGDNGSVDSPNRRFISFMINITTNRTQTPRIRDGVFRYEIHDLEVNQGTEFPGWLDLRNFFHDADPDDNLTYNVTFLEGEGVADIQIIDKHFVQARFINSGLVRLQFVATDGNSTAVSNEVRIDVSPKDQVSRNTGGSGSSVEYEKETRTTRKPIALDIIHPENITIYANDTARIPIRIQNNDEFTLTDITVNVSTTREGIGLSLDKQKIGTLDHDEFQNILLSVNLSKIYGTYDIYINVSVRDPEFTDSTKMLISSLKKGTEGDESTRMKLAFVSDLLTKNKECSELSEYIDRARDEFAEGNNAKGNELLEQFTNDCKALIHKSSETEKPASQSIQSIWDRIMGNRNYRIITLAVTLIIILSAIISVATLYKRV
ncbi:MAG: Ig-like domain-containing protein [Nanobdellota archaeon]